MRSQGGLSRNAAKNSRFGKQGVRRLALLFRVHLARGLSSSRVTLLLKQKSLLFSGTMHLSTAAVRKCHPAVYGVVFFALLIPLYHLSWQYHKGHPWRLPSRRPTRQPSKDFVGDWLNTHLVEPFNPSAVRSYCNATDWRPNLVFRFDRANGTIGDVRGNIVDFLFYALEAGASVVLPEIANVDKTDSGGALDGPTPFDHSFDEEWFINATSQACPQMTIYRSPDIETLPSALPAKYTPKAAASTSSPKTHLKPIATTSSPGSTNNQPTPPTK